MKAPYLVRYNTLLEEWEFQTKGGRCWATLTQGPSALPKKSIVFVDMNGEPTKYNCMINNYQRKMITAAMSNLIAEHAGKELSEEEAELVNEARIMRDMLMDLPKQELESPRVTHGLCL